jgi:hypothetical protein
VIQSNHKIIKMTICEVCGKEYTNVATHMRMAHPDNITSGAPVIKEDGVGEKSDLIGVGSVSPGGNIESKQAMSSEVMEMFSTIVKGISSLTDRVAKIEDKSSGNAFKKEMKTEDVVNAKVTRENVDARIVTIVDELLGEDFGIEIAPNKDNPGFMFTLIVPQRLSDLNERTRPVILPDGTYKKDKDGVVVEEMYIPDDRRSRAIASHQSFDAIRNHAEKVRSYIVAYYQKMNKPIPEFKLKQNGY